MSGYLLDTNAWIALLKNDAKVVAGVRPAGIESLFLCSPVWSELWFGACKSQRVAENQARKLWFGACKSQRVAENQARIRELVQQVPSLPFDDRAAEQCGEVRSVLAREGRPIGPYDLQIAAIALAADLCVVTRNVVEFSRVPGLSVENWQDQA